MNRNPNQVLGSDWNPTICPGNRDDAVDVNTGTALAALAALGLALMRWKRKDEGRILILDF